MTSLQTLPYKIFNQQLAVRTTSASISCFMSFLLLVMILWNQDGLKSPYSRIIFFISIGDILQSLGIIIGPHAIPKEYADLGAFWAKGTTTTCDIAGIVTAMGSIYLVPFYTLLLSYYFLKRVKDKVSPAQFTKTFEKKIHAFIWVFVLGACIYAYSKNFINPNEEGHLCMVFDTRDEFDCMLRDDPDEICSRGKQYRGLTILAMGPLSLVFLLLIFNLGRLISFVYREERLMHLEALDHEERRKNLEIKKRKSTLDSNETLDSPCNMNEQEERDQQQHEKIEQEENKRVQKKSCCCISKCRRKDADEKRSLTCEALIQSSMYVISFFVAYSLSILIYFLLEYGGGKVPIWLRWLQSALYPLNGLFTMLIYTRPKVQQARRNFPDIENFPYFVLLLIVIFSGGETPKEIDLGSSHNDEIIDILFENGFIEDNDGMLPQKRNYEISSIGDDESFFAKIRKVSKAIRSSHINSGNVQDEENNFISYDQARSQSVEK